MARNIAMSKLKVLLVVYAFPPAGGVGTLRAASLARYFPGQEIQLDVLTTRNPSSVGMDHSLLDDIPPEVTIHRTFTLDLPFGLKKRIKGLLTAGVPSLQHSVAPGTAVSKPGLLSRIVQDTFLPDPQVTWLPILTRAARRIVRERYIDIVVITGAPYSTYLLAMRLRKEFPGLPIVLDFRDEWVSTSCDPSSFHFSRTERARRFAIQTEAEVVASATAVVTVNRGALHEMRSRYPDEPPTKFYCIPNGFDGARVKMVSGGPRRQQTDKTRVTYLGTVSVYSDPSALVDALHSLSPEVKARFVFRFIGHIGGSRYRDKLLELGDIVELQGYLPQREALHALNDTDYVLLLTHDPLNVPAKFYDYLGSGKPILACTHPENDIRTMLEELRAGWWADSRDVQDIRQLFINAAARLDSLETDFRPDSEQIAQYERKPLAQRYAALLHSLAGRQLNVEQDSELAAIAGREA
jgi:hypothetical protein